MHAHSQESIGEASAADLRTADGIATAKWSSLGLLITGLIELAVSQLGGSAGLLADAFHNLGDVSTTLAVWVALIISRRQANERYPHGYHRIEDLAGLFVLTVMAASAAAAGYASIGHLVTGDHPTHLLTGAIAAAVGIVGNELVAQYKIHSGRRIGSVSLAADGVHSRTDGLVSLAALAGIGGVAAGFERADGLAGVVITLVIIGVVVSTARGVLGRALDAVDPTLTGQVEEVARSVPGVAGVSEVRLRWAGRALFVTLNILLPAEMPLAEAHAAAESVRHALLHAIENLREIDIHMDPSEEAGAERAHGVTAHHLDASGSLRGGDDTPHRSHDGRDHAHDGDHEPQREQPEHSGFPRGHDPSAGVRD